MSADIVAPDPKGRAAAERRLASQLRRELEPEPISPNRPARLKPRKLLVLSLRPGGSRPTHATGERPRPKKIGGHHLELDQVHAGDGKPKQRWTVACECGWNTSARSTPPKSWATEKAAKAAAARHYLEFVNAAKRRAAHERRTGIALPPGISLPPRRPKLTKKQAKKKAKNEAKRKRQAATDATGRAAPVAENKSPRLPSRSSE